MLRSLCGVQRGRGGLQGMLRLTTQISRRAFIVSQPLMLHASSSPLSQRSYCIPVWLYNLHSSSTCLMWR
jgi:hypothetical protein